MIHSCSHLLCIIQNAHVFNDSVIELAESLLETDGADQANNFWQTLFQLNTCITSEANLTWRNLVQAEGAKAAIKELLDIEAEAKAFAHALTALQSSYAPSERTTDFAQTLDKGSKRMLPIVRCSSPPSPAHDNKYPGCSFTEYVVNDIKGVSRHEAVL